MSFPDEQTPTEQDSRKYFLSRIASLEAQIERWRPVIEAAQEVGIGREEGGEDADFIFDLVELMHRCRILREAEGKEVTP
jgi:hypothetical protein